MAINENFLLPEMLFKVFATKQSGMRSKYHMNKDKNNENDIYAD